MKENKKVGHQKLVPDLPASGKVMDWPYCKGLLSSLALGECLDERKSEGSVGSCTGVNLSWEGRWVVEGEGTED